MDIGYAWGADQPPDPAAARAAETDADGLMPEQLPEVREPIARGWQLAPDAPMLVFLPLVWPPQQRTWVPDRATRYETWTELDPKTYEVLSLGLGIRPAGRHEWPITQQQNSG
ncbi:hypothetical protein AB0H57_32280 [Micromonospora sp. NPDC050686]|uniref:hypothetical protein n=1 Tax=Micromonospora sp. NPDC050686 TaxID=3154631 RepID=UPI0033DE7B3A